MAATEVQLTHFAARLEECPKEPLPEIALSGRSNVGKSSLLNYLVGRKRIAHTSGQPGKTKCFTYYRIEDRWNLVDMPGYGFARVSPGERQRWLRSAEEYYRGREQLAGVLQLIDLGVGPTNDDVARSSLLGELGKRLCIVFTKSDKVPRSKHEDRVHLALAKMHLAPDTGVVLSSAHAPYGDREIWAWIADQLASR